MRKRRSSNRFTGTKLGILAGSLAATGVISGALAWPAWIQEQEGTEREATVQSPGTSVSTPSPPIAGNSSSSSSSSSSQRPNSSHTRVPAARSRGS